ncbi:MAG: hypothetical protein MUF45_11225 [Spirosomaceae bacterium]|jgi:uncharacterized membrane-anchored protein YhcB (DUF1043 family)|nr:hypothetical protein [Spirosomataceae bacterium]
MNDTQDKPVSLKKLLSKETAIERLTALWAIHEAGLGGFVHLFDTPFTGIVMGSMSSVCIMFIAYFSDKNVNTLLKTVILVLIAKVVVSPHTSISAYVAVICQGVFGAYLFRYLPSFKLGVILLTVFALLESSIQRIVMLTLVHGNSIWKATDVFLAQVLEKFGVQISSGSIWLIGTYITIHILAGIVIGFVATGLLKSVVDIIKNDKQNEQINDTFIALNSDIKDKIKPQNTAIKHFLVFFSSGAIFLIFTMMLPEQKGLKYALYALIRTITFLVLWGVVIQPIALRLFNKYLSTKQQKYSQEVESMFSYMGTLHKLVGIAWKDSKQYRGLRRIHNFTTRSLAYTLLYQPDF